MLSRSCATRATNCDWELVAAVAALEFAARAVPEVFGSLYVPWGAFVHFRVGDQDLPAFGQGWGPFGFGAFTPNLAMPQPDGPLSTIYGDTWVAVIEFADPVRAMAVMPTATPRSQVQHMWAISCRSTQPRSTDRSGARALKLRRIWNCMRCWRRRKMAGQRSS